MENIIGNFRNIRDNYLGHAIQKYVFGGHEIRSATDLRAEKVDNIKGKDVFIIDEEHGVYFKAKATLLADNDKAEADKKSVFELTGLDGKERRFVIDDIVAEAMLNNAAEIPVEHSYMLDRTESDGFDEAIGVDKYTSSSFLSLLTGNRAFAVSNKEHKQHVKGAWRTAFAKFIDPFAEHIKPGLKNQAAALAPDDELKGELSKSKVTGKAVFAALLFATAVCFLGFAGAPILGFAVFALIPTSVILPLALVPLALAIGLHAAGNKLNGDTKAIIAYTFTAVVFASIVASLYWAAPLIGMLSFAGLPLFAPILLMVVPVVCIPLFLGLAKWAAKKAVEAFKSYNYTQKQKYEKIQTALKYLGLIFGVTPWLMGAVRYLVTSLVLVKPFAALLSLGYEWTVNALYNKESDLSSKIIGGIVYFLIVTPLLGLISGLSSITGKESPLSRVRFNSAQMDESSKVFVDFCHSISVTIAENFWRVLLISTVVSVMAIAIASTGGFTAILAILPFIGNIATLVSSLPLIGAASSWLFVTGPLAVLLTSTSVVWLTLFLGVGVSALLAYPMVRRAFTFVKDMTALRVKTGVKVSLIGLGVGIPLIVLGSPIVGAAVAVGALLYLLFSGIYNLYKRNRVAKLSPREQFAKKAIPIALAIFTVLPGLIWGVVALVKWRKRVNDEKEVASSLLISESESDSLLIEKNQEINLSRPGINDGSFVENEVSEKPEVITLKKVGKGFAIFFAAITVVPGLIWLGYNAYQKYQAKNLKLIREDVEVDELV